jgi:hypothetical protein
MPPIRPIIRDLELIMRGCSQYRFLGTTGSVRPIICDNLAAWVADDDNVDGDVVMM